MLKTLKLLVFLTTISCGYTSNLNNQNDLNNITNNNNIINNNLDNIINEHEDNNKISNTDKYLGKKRLSKKIIKKKNNAYKYLFNDNHNKYFSFDNINIAPLNPEYNQFMEDLYEMFNNCIQELFEKLRDDDENIDTETIEILKKNKIKKKVISDVAKKLDSFKFPEKKSYVLANNNLSNLNKYIQKHKSIKKKGVPFHDFYINYVYNHITKLYYQTARAVKKSIDNNEQTSKQSEIINEFGRVLRDVLDIISDKLFNDSALFFFKGSSYKNDKSDDLKKYSKALRHINGRIDNYSVTFMNDIRGFNYNNDEFLKQFDYLHGDIIKHDLNELIKNIDNYKTVKVDTAHDEQLKNENNELFDNLLNGLHVENNIFVLTCKHFLINGSYDIPVKQYLIKLLTNINILKFITVQKINYQIKNEHIISINNSVICYEFIIRNILENIKKQYNKDDELYKKLDEMIDCIDHEAYKLYYYEDYECD